MSVISTDKDVEALTFTVVAEFDAPPDRVWQVWEDPRLLERWWGPPTWPATFVRHELEVGGQAHYFMTGPDGTKAHGTWAVTAVERPHRLEFLDSFADQNGRPVDDPPATPATVTLEAVGSGTRMTVVSQFSSPEHLQQILDMGMAEGLTQAMNQIDDLLARTEAG